MKKCLVSLLALLLCLTMVISVHAASPLLVDEADLLTSKQEADLLSRLEQIRTDRKIDLVIVTTNDLQGKTPEAFADDFFDYGGYQENGILLLVSPGEGEVYVSTSGSCISAISDRDIVDLLDDFDDAYHRGDYSGGFTGFVKSCDRLLTNTASRFKFAIRLSPMRVIVSIILGIIIACIVTGAMKKELKTVVPQKTANNYILMGSLQLTRTKDTFLYRNVVRVPRPKDSGSGSRSSGGGSRTHTGSSGRSHGGGGRRL